MSKSAELVLEYPMQINGQDVIVKRYDNPEMEARISDHSELSFHNKGRLNNRPWRRKRPTVTKRR